MSKPCSRHGKKYGCAWCTPGPRELYISISVDSDQWDGISPEDEKGWKTVTSLRDLSLYPNISLNQSESKLKNNAKREQ